jgi:glycosyltransferase involved in cell wall biosynthesis
MRLLLLPRYGPKGANSRYRLWQYVPLLKQAGFEVDVKPMLGDDYLEQLYSCGKRPLSSTIQGYLRGIARTFSARHYDVVLLDQEMVPYFPPALETIIAKQIQCLIVDYDDAAYCKYSRLPILRNKISKIMARSSAVVVGNHHLARYARKFATDVRLIPTVVDLLKYKPKNNYSPQKDVRICWIGTPITAVRFLKPMLPLFRDLQRRISNLQFRFIGAGNLRGDDSLRVEQVEWSEDTEADRIAECDIGIMPLQDEEFERGKCGLKLVQYMAAGLPIVASPVGENRFIVDHGQNGFLASEQVEWFQWLELLVRDYALRAEMGTKGRQKAEQRYSLIYGFGLWSQLLQDLYERRRHLSQDVAQGEPAPFIES